MFYQEGHSYSYDGLDYKYENTYHFWRNSVDNLDTIKGKIMYSPFTNRNIDINDILIPEFLEWYKKTNFKKLFGIVTADK